MLDGVDDIGEWLDVDLLDAEGEDGQPPDMFVVGLQEVGVCECIAYMYGKIDVALDHCKIM